MQKLPLRYLFLWGAVLVLLISTIALFAIFLETKRQIAGANITIDETFDIPIKTIIPIHTTVSVPVTIPIIGQTVILKFPIDTTVPIDVTVSIPIKKSIPIKLK